MKGPFYSMANKVASFQARINQEVIMAAAPAKKKMIELNRDDQMFERGVKADNTRIGDYAASTRIYKKEAGQRHDHMTLRDTAAFHESIDIEFGDSEFVFTANDKKINDKGGTDSLLEIHGKEILGLTDDSLNFIKDKFIKPNLIESFRFKVLERTNKIFQ